MRVGCSRVFGLITIILFVVAFKSLKKKVPEDSPVAIEDKKFYKYLGYYEMYTRHVESLYGKNQEAKDVLAQFGKLIAEVKDNKKKNRNKLTLMLVLIALLTMLIPFFYNVIC